MMIMLPLTVILVHTVIVADTRINLPLPLEFSTKRNSIDDGWRKHYWSMVEISPSSYSLTNALRMLDFSWKPVFLSGETLRVRMMVPQKGKGMGTGQEGDRLET